MKVLLGRLLKSRSRHRHFVIANANRCKRIQALLVALRVQLQTCARIRQQDRCAGNHGTRIILNCFSNGSLIDLRMRPSGERRK